MTKSVNQLADEVEKMLTSDLNEPQLLAAADGTRIVALTFDDGPSRTQTGGLLDYLLSENIKVVFFVLGSLVATAEGKLLVQRAHAEGHLIGNHSYTHPDLTKLSRTKVESELRRTHDLIVAIAGECTLFRPPYGAANATVRSVATQLGYQTVLWNVDTLDWKMSDNRWVNHAINQIKSRSNCTVLNHDIHPTTVSRVPGFVKRIRDLGPVNFVQI
jgi:peptidoglycan/xylan/chitin deacetylase (PgdA/CDA1 family)